MAGAVSQHFGNPKVYCSEIPSMEQQFQDWTFGQLQEIVRVPSLQVGSNSQGAAMAVVADAPRPPSTAHARASHVPIAT